MADQTRTHQIVINGDTDSTRDHPKAKQIVKAVTAVTAGGSLLVLSGLTLAGTVIALTVATPLFVIFSPILVPALITVTLINTGFLASGGFGMAAMTAFSWLYRHVRGSVSDKVENARMNLGSRAQDIKYGQHHTGSIHHQQQQAS